MTKLDSPIKILGKTEDNRFVLGGAFQMADTFGFPFSEFLIAADDYNAAASSPHYFVSALESGWDDLRAFARIEESYRDAGKVLPEDYQARLIAFFMRFARPGLDARPIATAARQALES